MILSDRFSLLLVFAPAEVGIRTLGVEQSQQDFNAIIGGECPKVESIVTLVYGLKPLLQICAASATGLSQVVVDLIDYDDPRCEGGICGDATVVYDIGWTVAQHWPKVFIYQSASINLPIKFTIKVHTIGILPKLLFNSGKQLSSS